MGMFGNLFQKKQPAMGDFTFHNSLPYAGSADGLPTPAPAPDDGNQRIKPSFMGILADALAGAAGTAPQYAPMLQKQKQRQMDLADYNRKRQDDLAQWQVEQQWKIDHKDPPAEAASLEWWNKLTPEEKQQYATMMDVKSPVAVAGPTGTYRVPRSYGQPAGIKPGAVEDGHIFKGGNPADPASWEPIGGQTPQASGGFPGSY